MTFANFDSQRILTMLQDIDKAIHDRRSQPSNNALFHNDIWPSPQHDQQKIIAYLKYMKKKELIKINTIRYMGQELIEILELTGEAHIVLDND